MFFSVQQFFEGLLWLSLTNNINPGYGKIFTFIFLIFAQVVWPTWVPFSIWLIEKNASRKRILSVCVVIGIIVSVYLGYSLIKYPVSAIVSAHHIRYDIDFPLSGLKFLSILYFIPTVIAPILSTVNKVWIIGISALLAYITSRLLFQDYVISIWCFFAATISITIFYVIWHMQKAAAVVN